MGIFTPCPEVLLAYREEIPAARSGLRTVLYLPTAAPLPLASTLSVQKIYFIDLETRKTLRSTLPVQVKGSYIWNRLPVIQDALLIMRRRITMLNLNTSGKELGKHHGGTL